MLSLISDMEEFVSLGVLGVKRLKIVVGRRYLFLQLIPLTLAMTETPREVVPTG